MPRPDEGLIHAWLDGQLPSVEAERIERLTATDPDWAAAVAEARGLVAVSSRILSALDRVPSGVIPKQTPTRAGRRLPWWTKAAAAVVLVAGGSVLVMQRTPDREVPNVAVSKPAVLTPAVPEPAVEGRAAPVRETQDRVKPAYPAPKRANVAGTTPQGEALRSVTVPARPSESNAAASVEAPIAGLPVTPPTVPPLARPLAGAQVMSVRAERARDLRARGDSTKSMPYLDATGKGRAARPAVGAAGGAVNQLATARVVCYLVRETTAPKRTGIVMRVERQDGDTLRLVSTVGASPTRAWVVWRDFAGLGALMPADSSRALPIIAEATDCPKP